MLNPVPTESRNHLGVSWGHFSFLLPPSTSGAVRIPGVVQGLVRRQVSALMPFCVFSVPMAKRMLERLAVASALEILPRRCQALLGVK